ncbi:ABC transporter substrate-binding protein, partial [Camelimonas abortus]
MLIHTTRLLTITTAIAVTGVSIAVAEPSEELIAAAKAEGELTTIALPHDWCGYGEIIQSFKDKY